MKSRISLLLAAVLVFGCTATGGNREAAAGDEPATGGAAGKADATPDGGKKKDAHRAKKAPSPVLDAAVTDTSKVEHELRNVLFFVPTVSLFGSSEGDGESRLLVRHGTGEYEVPLAEVATIEVLSTDNKVVRVKITYRQKGGKARVLEGSVKANLELKGDTEFGRVTFKLREVRRITFHAPRPAAQAGK